MTYLHVIHRRLSSTQTKKISNEKTGIERKLAALIRSIRVKEKKA